MKKHFPILLVAILCIFGAVCGESLSARAYSLACSSPPAGSQPPLFYYVTGMPAGTVATYTATLPAWFTATGGIAVAPDSTGATGFKLALPSTFPAAGVQPSLTGSAMACDGVGCTAAVPFGPPSAPANVLITSP